MAPWLLQRVWSRWEPTQAKWGGWLGERCPAEDGALAMLAAPAGDAAPSGAGAFGAARVLETRPTLVLHPGETGRGYESLYGGFAAHICAALAAEPLLQHLRDRELLAPRRGRAVRAGNQAPTAGAAVGMTGSSGRGGGEV